MSATKVTVRGLASVALASLTAGALMAGDLWPAALLALAAYVAWPKRRKSTQHTGEVTS